MQTENEHPLAIWLEKHGESAMEFAEFVGVSFSTIYHLMSGRTKMPQVPTLQAIQTGTGGEVTIQEMIAWTQKQQRRTA